MFNLIQEIKRQQENESQKLKKNAWNPKFRIRNIKSKLDSGYSTVIDDVLKKRWN